MPPRCRPAPRRGPRRLPTLSAPSSLTPLEMAAGTTSRAVSFGEGSGGVSPLSYSLAVAGGPIGSPATLSTSSGRSATVSGLADGYVYRVTLTATDAMGQTATASAVYGVGTAPVYDEVGIWSAVETVDLRDRGTGSRTTAGALVVDGQTVNLVSIAGPPTGMLLDWTADGVAVRQTSGTGTATGAYLTFASTCGETGTYRPGETILLDFVITLDTVPNAGVVIVGLGDGTTYNTGDGFDLSLSATSATVANLNGRRWQSSAATTYTMASGVASTGRTFAVQIVMIGQRIGLLGVSEVSGGADADFLAAPIWGRGTMQSGALTCCLGGAGASTGAALTSPFAALRLRWGIIHAAVRCTVHRARLSRYTRNTV